MGEQTNKDAAVEKILKERYEKLSQKTDTLSLKDNEDLDTYLVVSIGEEKYAIASEYVREVSVIKEITDLPCTPGFLLGIVNVRGDIISLTDIKKIFDHMYINKAAYSKMVIISNNDIRLAIAVNEIIESMSVDKSLLQKELTSVTDSNENYIEGVTTEGILVLDINKLLMSQKLIVNEEV